MLFKQHNHRACELQLLQTSIPFAWSKIDSTGWIRPW